MMPAVRSSLLVLRRGLQAVCCSHSIHPTSQRCVKTSARKPRLTKRVSTRIPQAYQNPSDSTEYLPPIVLLNTARNSGVLDIDAKEAVEFLREYHDTAQNASPGWEKRLCQRHNVSPRTLTLLGMILGKCPGEGQRVMATRLMTTASDLGENVATLALVSGALRTLGVIDTLPGPVQRCRQLAEQDGEPQAMLLHGKVLLQRGSAREAASWFSKAGKCSQTRDDNVQAEALVHEGLVLRALKDGKAARAAFLRAAEMDEPLGYYLLSEFEEPGSATEYEYLLKAASGGEDMACYKLGLIELGKVERNGEAKSLSDFGMAREWFEVASAAGHGESMLRMASICKASGQSATGLIWLESAGKVREVKEEAKSLKRGWADH